LKSPSSKSGQPRRQTLDLALVETIRSDFAGPLEFLEKARKHWEAKKAVLKTIVAQPLMEQSRAPHHPSEKGGDRSPLPPSL
jgi:hypothetical protein